MTRKMGGAAYLEECAEDDPQCGRVASVFFWGARDETHKMGEEAYLEENV